MKMAKDQKGIALLTTLMLMVLGFGLVATLLYMVTYGTKTAGLERDYALALEAAKGGLDLAIDVVERVWRYENSQNFIPPNLDGRAAYPSWTDACRTKIEECCLTNKIMNSNTDDNVTGNWRYCLRINSSKPEDGADLKLTLQNHEVCVKIVDTRKTITNTHANYYYTINAKAQALGGRGASQANITCLYLISNPLP